MSILDDKNLQTMWNIAEISSAESGTPTHQIFAKLLYSKFMKKINKTENY